MTTAHRIRMNRQSSATVGRPLACAAIAVSALAAHPAAAQVFTAEAPPYTVRANAVASTFLPAETASAHGIRQSPHVGVLNVVVLRGEAPNATVPAEVEARFADPGAESQPIPMRPTRAQGEVSYLGTFFMTDPVMTYRFEIRVRVPDAPPITLRFRDRLDSGG